METKQLPSDIQIEKTLLGHLIFDPDLISTVRDKLDVDDFYAEENKVIFEFMLGPKSSADELVIYNELKSRKNIAGEELVPLSYLNSLTDGQYKRNSVDDYVDILKKKSFARRVIERASILSENAYKTWDDVRRTVESSSDDLLRMYEQARFISGEKIFDPDAKAKMYMNVRFNQGTTQEKIAIKDWPIMNRKLGGGFKRGRVYVIAARPSSGKTSFLVHLCSCFARLELPGLMMQIENPEHDIYDKMVANICTFDSEKISDDPYYLKDEQKKDRFRDAIKVIGKSFCIEHKSTINVHEICQRVFAYKKQRKIQWFMVDYLQRIEGDRRKNDLENITYNIRVLDDLAEKLDLVCILVSMANRDAEGGKIRMKHMKGSGEIEQDADVLIAIQSDESKSDEDEETVGVEIIKNRYGRKGIVDMRFNKASSQFTEKEDQP